MSDKCTCLKKFDGDLKDRHVEDIVKELNYLLYGEAQKDCRATEKKALGFVAPKHLAERFDGLSAYTRTEADGVWHNDYGTLFVDDNYVYSVEFKDDKNSCIRDRAFDLLTELIKREKDGQAEESAYIYATKVEKSTL